MKSRRNKKENICKPGRAGGGGGRSPDGRSHDSVLSGTTDLQHRGLVLSEGRVLPVPGF